MQLGLSEEQTRLAQTARAFFRELAAVGRLRQLRDHRDAHGYSRELWQEMAALGWVGMCLPEAYGGAGLGFVELCVVLEEAGRQLAPEPWTSTVLLGAQALLDGGSEAQRARWLPEIANGRAVVALAYEEIVQRGELARIETRAERHGSAWKLSGEKVQVLDAHVSDALLVFACVGDKHALFLVNPRAHGVEIERHTRIDGRNSASVRMREVEVAADSCVGELGQALPLLERVLDRATIGASAEMLGGASRAFDDTLDYLKTRQQFGVAIGTFQALAHRAARLFIELSLARSAVMAAASAVDEHPEQVARLASLAKVRCSDAFVHVTSEAIQMHGGIGVTDDFHMGFFFKRARAAAVAFGDSTWHLRRWATLGGY